MTSFATGSTLCDGRYQLEEVLGRGGMSIVWRAQDLQLERPVAIKVISDVLATDPRFVARFEREARLAAMLSHPNLVKVFDFSVDGERPFLVMEYIAGGTLVDARGRGLDPEPLARELLDAVAHIHGAGILHRDIKPANVLLASDGSPRLTDFGIARGEETTGLTQTGQVLGTLRYIAPEVAAGQPATPQSDLYSLGVLLQEVAGNPSVALAALLQRMTASDPSVRPASAAEALAELDPTRPLMDTDATRALDQTGATAPLAANPQPNVEVPGTYSVDRGAWRPARSQALAAGAVLLAVLAIVIVAASSGGGSELTPPRVTSLQPAPAGAPAAQQLTQLEKLVRAAQQR